VPSPYEDDSSNIHIESNGSCPEVDLGCHYHPPCHCCSHELLAPGSNLQILLNLIITVNTNPVDHDDDDDDDILHMQSWCQLGLTKL
jgi:hypothetical protein